MSSKFGLMNPSCIRCGSRIGALSADEADVFYASGDSMLCFDCDEFENVARVTDFVVAEIATVEQLERYRSYEREAQKQSHARAHERTHVRTRLRNLSSYTKLNRNTKKTGFIEDGVESFLCAPCSGTGIIWEFNSHYKCLWCDGEGKHDAFIYLPRWIISGGQDA